MRLLGAGKISFALLASCALILASPARAGMESYKSERQNAVEIYGKSRINALPLLENLIKRNPEDAEILVMLAGALISRAVTLDDQEAAANERIRAKKHLLEAKRLGHDTPLVQTLLEEMESLPADGTIRYSQIPAADRAMHEAESALARHDFVKAIQGYAKALEWDPENYSAAVFLGDAYFELKNYAKSSEWYDRASQMNPDAETAYRYHADMLTKRGDLKGARTKAIQAVVAEPYKPKTWRGLEQWAEAAGVSIRYPDLGLPKDPVVREGTKIVINLDPDRSAEAGPVWMAYSLARAKWMKTEFSKRFPSTKTYRHTLAEESEALNTAAAVLKELNAKSKPAAETVDPSLVLLLELHQAGMIAPHILLSAADQGIARDYAAYRAKNRERLEAYLKKFVVPPVPASE